MKTIKTAIMAAVAILSLPSCEKEIKFTGKQHDTSIVMFAVASPGKALSANIRQSAFILDPDSWETMQKGIPGAKVNAFTGEGGQKIPLSLNGSTSTEFTCGYCPVAGERIRIEAEADGFRSVYAETIVPRKPEFSIESIRSERGEYDEDIIIYMKIRIDDPGEEKNFYRLKLSCTYLNDDTIWTQDYSGEPFETQEPISQFYSMDPIFKNDSYNNIFGTGMEEDAVTNYFTDSRFNGESYTFEIYFHLYSSSYIKASAINAEMQALSKEYYEYTASLDAYYESDDFSLFSEPVQILCNVENGIGCFGALNQSSRTVSIE